MYRYWAFDPSTEVKGDFHEGEAPFLLPCWGRHRGDDPLRAAGSGGEARAEPGGRHREEVPGREGPEGLHGAGDRLRIRQRMRVDRQGGGGNRLRQRHRRSPWQFGRLRKG